MSRYANRFQKFPQGLGDDTATTSDTVINPPDLTQVTNVQKPIWIDPPTNWENIDVFAYAPLGAIGASVTILTFIVPTGRNGVIYAIANNFVGGGWIEGTGDVVWQILVDGAPPPGANSYGNIFGSLGSPASPTRISGFRVFDGQTVTVVALNNPAGPNGGVVLAGQRVGARLLGHLYPRDLEADSLWI